MDAITLTAARPGAGGSRFHRSLTADVEKRALVWMAARLPHRVTSDHLTALGLASSLAIGAAFASTPAWPAAPLLVVPLLVINWLGDSLDGTVARVRHQQRPRYGFYIDHVIDIAGMTAIGAGLSMSGLMAPALGLAVALAYVLLAAESFLAAHTIGSFRISFGPFGPTELRIVLAAGAIKAASSPWVDIGPASVRLFDVGGTIAVAGMLVVFVIAAIRNGALLFAAEPLPAADGGRRA